MKKGITLLIFACLYLSAFTTNISKQIDGNSILPQVNVDFINTEKSNSNQIAEVEKATELYNKFLAGYINVDGVDIDYITIPTGEPHRRYTTKYALFDSNGDGISDLHVNSARYYYIFTVKDDNLVIWKLLSPNPLYYALNNGGFINRRYGVATMSDEYNFILFDYSGKKVFSLNFSKYDQDNNGKYNGNDEYLFDNVKVSEEVWKALTKRYLYIDEKGIEQIRSEIDWIVIYK